VPEGREGVPRGAGRDKPAPAVAEGKVHAGFVVGGEVQAAAVGRAGANVDESAGEDGRARQGAVHVFSGAALAGGYPRLGELHSAGGKTVERDMVGDANGWPLGGGPCFRLACLGLLGE